MLSLNILSQKMENVQSFTVSKMYNCNKLVSDKSHVINEVRKCIAFSNFY